MPKIFLEHHHALEPSVARERIQALMDRFARKYGFSARWEEDTRAHVKGRGVTGAVVLQPGTVRFELAITRLLFPLRSLIEEGIKQQVSQALV